MTTTTVTSATRTVEITVGEPTVIIGERCNALGYKTVMEAVKRGDWDLLARRAAKQVETGAAVINVNVAATDVDEADAIIPTIQAIGMATDAPLSLDVGTASGLSAALKVYQGKPLINSINGEAKKLDQFMPILQAANPRPAVIAILIDENGIPDTAFERLQLARRLVRLCEEIGIPPADVIIDPVCLAISTNSSSGRVMFETMRLVRSELGSNLTCGASNVSFGLPDRRMINAHFLSMGIANGLNCPLTDPTLPEVLDAILTADMLFGSDEFAMRFLAHFRDKRARAEQLAGGVR